jgi:hypothetical protein
MSSQREFSAALLDPLRPCPEGLKAWNGSDPGKRFAVYRNNVTSSLIDALADTFPVLQALVGEEFFRAMARLFVQTAPPDSPILAHYGAGLADFVAGFAPAQSLPYLADMARLEYARVQAYHAADAQAVSQPALAAAMAVPERIAQLQLQLHPSLQLLRSDWAVLSLWSEHQGGPAVDRRELAAPEDMLVLRSGLEVAVLLLAPGVADFALALQRDLALGEAAGCAAQAHPGFDLGASLALLLRLGAITALHQVTGETP